mmetsp:Transcript_96940/g.172549  ORF Transcript_96940/g.172549 Transcript_96940/m.172549 type:complete len:175 (-) Transcript_96940:38-562(-)
MWWADHGTTGIRSGLIDRHTDKGQFAHRAHLPGTENQDARMSTAQPVGRLQGRRSTSTMESSQLLRLQLHPELGGMMTPRGCRPGWNSGLMAKPPADSWLSRPDWSGTLQGPPLSVPPRGGLLQRSKSESAMLADLGGASARHLPKMSTTDGWVAKGRFAGDSYRGSRGAFIGF